MTKITYNAGKFCLSAQGHTGYGKSGSDILCAAVSCLMQTLSLALRERGIRQSLITDDSIPLYSVRAEPEAEQRYPCVITYSTITAGLRRLANDYPEYIQFTEDKEA